MRKPIVAALSMLLIFNVVAVLALSVAPTHTAELAMTRGPAAAGPAPTESPTPAPEPPATEPAPTATTPARPVPPQPQAAATIAAATIAATPTPRAAPTPAPADPIAPCATPNGRLVTETLASRVLGIGLPVHVFLPPCYDPAAAYPTLYLIHGTDAAFGGWVYRQRVDRAAGALMKTGDLPPFLIVMPGSDVNRGSRSVYSWSNNGKGSFEDMLVNELLPFVERKYGARADRAGRAIGGISRGGYWSIEAGFANPEVFGVVGGHSPSIGTFLIGMPRGFTGMLYYAASIDGVKRQRIWLDAGDRDWARADAAKLSRELTAKGIQHALDIGKGAHADAYWASRVNDYLRFYAAGWRPAPAPGP